MPWADAANGDVARRLGAKEEKGDGGGGIRCRGEGAVRLMPGRGGARNGVSEGGSGLERNGNEGGVEEDLEGTSRVGS